MASLPRQPDSQRPDPATPPTTKPRSRRQADGPQRHATATQESTDESEVEVEVEVESGWMPACLAAATLVLPAGAAPADTYPSHPLQMVIPFPPGGATDVIGRLLAKKLGDRWARPWWSTTARAGTIVGAGFAAKAAPDGYHAAGQLGHHFHRQSGDPSALAL